MWANDNQQSRHALLWTAGDNDDECDYFRLGECSPVRVDHKIKWGLLWLVACIDRHLDSSD